MCPTGPRGFFVSGPGSPSTVLRDCFRDRSRVPGPADDGPSAAAQSSAAQTTAGKGHGVGATTVTPSDVAGAVSRATANRAKTTMTGAQSLARSLEQVGADVVFGIPGGATLPAYAPLLASE